MGSPWSIPPPKARRAATSCSWRAFAPGLVVAIIISQIDYEFIAALWPVWGVIALVLVALTYTGLGLNVGGTDDTAWLGITVGQPPADLSAVGAAENRLYHHLLQAFVHGPGTY